MLRAPMLSEGTCAPAKKTDSDPFRQFSLVLRLRMMRWCWRLNAICV
jgi:hypothetical protein